MAFSKSSRCKNPVAFRVINEGEILPRETLQKVRAKILSVRIHRRRTSDITICYLDKISYRNRIG